MPASSITCFAYVFEELDACRGGCGPEHEHTSRRAGVGHACGGRSVGSDDDQVDRALHRERRDRLRVGDVDCDVLRDLTRAAVAGSDDDRHVRCIAMARPRQRVLASPGADDEDSPYSHSIVDGGLLEMSYTTRFTPGTSLTMRRLINPSTSYGTLAQSAVIPSSLSTMRTATTLP